MKPEVNVEQGKYWNYGPPPVIKEGSKMLLLTEGKIAILGSWRNCVGAIAWYPLPDRDKEKEIELGL